MRREHYLARLLRALSGLSQAEMGKAIGVHPTLISQFEQGRVVPSHLCLKRMVRLAGMTLEHAEELLDFAVVLRSKRKRRAPRAEGFSGLEASVVAHMARAERRLALSSLAQAGQETPLPPPVVADELQARLCAKLCEESADSASRQLETAAALVELAQETAKRIQAQGLRTRAEGCCAVFRANVSRVKGELLSAETVLAEGEGFWNAGSDPAGIFERGRLLDVKASLLRDQRRFGEAIACLDQAVAVGRSPERSLVNKGFTLEVMGDYRGAVEALFQAAPLVERSSDQRLRNILRYNLAVSECHLGLYDDAARRVSETQSIAEAMGDKIALIRMTWLRGRIAAGLGRRDEARHLLREARREFAGRGMSYDVALALLEEAALLLDDGQTAEVKVLTEGLAVVFESKGVHREALAALRLFQEAVNKEAASAELARRVLGFLFRARHDQELRFGES